MEWRDEGVILSVRRYGETDALVTLMTSAYGRHAGLMRGGASRRHAGWLQPGTGVRARWVARLEDHLGRYELEPERERASAVFDNALGLTGLTALGALAEAALPEREAHPGLYGGLKIVLDVMVSEAQDGVQEALVWPAALVRWELGLLQELGYGLDLTKCAATGSREDLVYVSPRTGRAVSRTAGAPYAGKLLRLPGFLLGAQAGTGETKEVSDGLRLTGFFLDKWLLAPEGRSLPDARRRLLDMLSA